jgi:hypothetical protein
VSGLGGYRRAMRGMVCGCCGRWQVTVERISGRFLYRLSRLYRAEVGGGRDVLGEVTTVAALAELLAARTPLTLADLRELP